ncbi:hypothetical protein BJ912DRAFT_954752 [Pholiota molesta]|nr:hypothetical protein BJ912DRAFT_954752 [Pholiota molesta]
MENSYEVVLLQHAEKCRYIGAAGLVEYVWSAKHTFPKFLFFSSLSVLLGSLGADNIDTVCLGVLSTGTGNFLVLLRLWTLDCSTLTFFILAQAVLVSPSFSYDPNLQLWALYAPPVILDGIALLAVTWNALARPRRSHSALVKQLYTDRFGYILYSHVRYNCDLFLSHFIWATTTVTVSRLIIDLRKQAIINSKVAKAIALPELNI